MTDSIWAFIAAVPSELAGLPTWMLNGISIGGLVTFIVAGLMTSRLWTKSQVDMLREDHKRDVSDLKERYETHLNRTIELWQGRTEDAIRREQEWRGVANRWQEVSENLGAAVGDMQDQSATTLGIVQEMQRVRYHGRAGQ